VLRSNENSVSRRLDRINRIVQDGFVLALLLKSKPKIHRLSARRSSFPINILFIL
jgi:hypothetical protein